LVGDGDILKDIGGYWIFIDSRRSRRAITDRDIADLVMVYIGNLILRMVEKFA